MEIARRNEGCLANLPVQSLKRFIADFSCFFDGSHNLYNLQYDSAATTLVSIGGVEFLSQLRGHIEPSLHPLIDDTLEHMLRVPLSSTCELP